MGLRNWSSGFNSGSGSTHFPHGPFNSEKQTLSKNYIHSSHFDQSDKGILRLYCLIHACHSKMSVLRCLSDLSVQVVRRSTLNRFEVHFRVQGPTKTSSISKGSVMPSTNSVTVGKKSISFDKKFLSTLNLCLVTFCMNFLHSSECILNLTSKKGDLDSGCSQNSRRKTLWGW